VVDVALLLGETQVVDALELAGATQREERERLRLAAREQCAAVGAGDHADLGADVADLLGAAAVRAALLDGDAPADDVLLELGGGAADHGETVRVDVVAAGERLDDRGAQVGGRRLTVRLLDDLRDAVHLGAVPALHLGEHAGIDGELGTSHFGLPTSSRSWSCTSTSFWISAWAILSASTICASSTSFARPRP